MGNEFFNNAGTFRKSLGSGTANISVAFTNINAGTVTNLIGILNFNEGGTLTGSYDTAAGATTDFAGGNFTMGVPPVISGPGVCEFTGTTLTLTAECADQSGAGRWQPVFGACLPECWRDHQPDVERGPRSAAPTP